MVIYLKHPIHGTKVACGEGEAIFDESNGWIRFDPYDSLKNKVENIDHEKRGRKPKSTIPQFLKTD